MGSGFRQMFLLLQPHVRPRIGALCLIVVLATIAAFGLRAPMLLLDPLWNQVIFPQQQLEEVAPDTEENRAQRALDRGFESARSRVSKVVLGEHATPQAERRTALWTVSILLVFAALVSALAHYLFQTISRWVSLRLVLDLRMRLAGHLLGLSMRYHGQRRMGDVLSRMAEDVSQTLSVVRLSMKELVLEPILVVASLAVSAVVAPGLTLLVVLVLSPLTLPLGLLGKRVRRRSRKSLSTLGSTVQVLVQMLQGIRTVKAFNAEQRELENYRRVNEAYVRHAMRTERTVALARSSTILLSHIGFAALLVGVGLLIINRQLFSDGSEMMQFFGGLALSYTHIRRVLDAVTRVQEATGAADRLQHILAEQTDLPQAVAPVSIDSLGRGIQLHEVCFAYPDTERDAISDLSLDIRHGETLALVGPSGAGKTTLIDLIARFIDPRTGRVTVDGHDIRNLAGKSWSSLFAMVGQDPFLFHASISENIRYGRPSATADEIEAAARAANIHEFICSLPKGYETQVGDAGTRLSGGERQRMTIARAIVKGAPLLFLDEATSALDSESERLVQEALDRLMQGRTVIVIAHRLSTIRDADRIAVLEAGRLRELGTHDELLSAGGIYARLHQVQYRGDDERPAPARP